MQRLPWVYVRRPITALQKHGRSIWQKHIWQVPSMAVAVSQPPCTPPLRSQQRLLTPCLADSQQCVAKTHMCFCNALTHTWYSETSVGLVTS